MGVLSTNYTFILLKNIKKIKGIIVINKLVVFSKEVIFIIKIL